MADPKAETERRIRQMVAFIRQEARDKAEEINVKANEECNVEVLKMVDREKAKLREHYKQQEKRIEIETKIGRQKLLDEYRMQLLREEDQKIQAIARQAQERFAGITADARQYAAYMKDSMMQCFIKIWDENQVHVQCRAEDAALVQRIMQDALKEVKARARDETGVELTMKASFNKKPLNISGGVLVSARGGRIICDNTLDARLKLTLKACLPILQNRLFDQESLMSS